jgi:hypothetical protein
MPYSLPTSSTINASQGLIAILLYVNEVTNSWFARLLLIGLFVIIVMGYYRARQDFIGGFALAGFGTFIIGFLFFIGGFVTGIDLAFAFAIMIVGVVWILVDKQGTA